MARTSANASRKRDLNDGEIETILAAVDQLESVNYVKLAEKLNMTKEAAAKRWSRLKEKQFGLRKKDAGEEGVAGKSQVNFSRYIHAHHFPLFLISSLAFFAHNTTQFQLAKGHCSPHRPVYTISSLTLPSTTMASPAPALKQADVELLIAVCEQFGEVDPKKLGEKLGCTSNAAYKRWKRFKERNFGDEKANGEEGEGSEANVTTPMTPKGGKADGKSQLQFTSRPNFDQLLI